MFSAIASASNILATGYESSLKGMNTQLLKKGYSDEKLNAINTAYEQELEAECNLRMKRLSLLEAKYNIHKAHSGEAHECSYMSSKNVGCIEKAYNKHENKYFCDKHYKAVLKENCGFIVEGGNFCKIKASKKFETPTLFSNNFNNKDFNGIGLCSTHYKKVLENSYEKCKKVAQGVRCSHKAVNNGYCEEHKEELAKKQSSKKKQESESEESESEESEEDE